MNMTVIALVRMYITAMKHYDQNASWVTGFMWLTHPSTKEIRTGTQRGQKPGGWR